MILCRETTSCKMVKVEILRGDTRSLSADLRASIRKIKYQHASCIQIVNCTPSWITSYICSIFHGCLVVPYLLTRKRLVSKVDMWIILEYHTRTTGGISGGCYLRLRIYLSYYIEELSYSNGIHIDVTFNFACSCICFISNTSH